MPESLLQQSISGKVSTIQSKLDSKLTRSCTFCSHILSWDGLSKGWLTWCRPPQQDEHNSVGQCRGEDKRGVED